MLSGIVGQVSLEAALVLAVGFVCICVVATALIVKSRSRLVLDKEFQLAKMRIDAQSQLELFRADTERTIKTKQTEQNLITSHRDVDQSSRHG